MSFRFRRDHHSRASRRGPLVVVRALIRRPAIDSEQARLVCFLILIIPVVRDLPPTVDGPCADNPAGSSRDGGGDP